MWIDLSEWARNTKILASYINAYLRETSGRRILTVKQIGYPALWITVGLFLQLPLSSSSWAHEGSSHDGRDGGSPWGHFHSLRLTWLQPLPSVRCANSREQPGVFSMAQAPAGILQGQVDYIGPALW